MRPNLLRLLVVVALAGSIPRVACAAPSASGSPEAFFGLTNVWTLHLTIAAEQWKSLEPTPRQLDRRGPGPGGGRRPGERDLRDRRPDDGGIDGPPERRPRRGERVEEGGRPEDGGFGGPGGGGPGGGPGGRRPGPMSLDFPWGTATLEIGNSQDVLTNVGVRFKGNSSFNASRQSDKKPFKLDFNRHVPGRQFFGLNALFLNNNVNELAYVREPLAYEAFRKAGFPASRTAIVRLYLTIPGVKDHEYLGLYTAVEPVDNLFLDRRLGGHQGLLVKPEGVQGLNFFGDDWHAYTNRYEVHSKLKESDAERLVALTRHVNRSSDGEFARRLGDFMDVDAALRFVALNAMLANLDSFNGNGHNYYLFVSRKTGKATFIPWDLNEAFGGHPGGGPAAAQLELSVLHPASPGNRFVARILADPSLSARYREICDQLLKDAFTVDPMIASAEQVTATAAGFLREEPRRSRMRLGPGGRLGDGGGGAPGQDAEGREPRGPRAGRGPDGGFQEGDGPNRPRQGVPRGPAGIGGLGQSMPIVDWIRQRDVMIREELAGKREGLPPQMRRGGGGGGGPQRPERF